MMEVSDNQEGFLSKALGEYGSLYSIELRVEVDVVYRYYGVESLRI